VCRPDGQVVDEEQLEVQVSCGGEIER
jgi:hypothetical protein